MNISAGIVAISHRDPAQEPDLDQLNHALAGIKTLSWQNLDKQYISPLAPEEGQQEGQAYWLVTARCSYADSLPDLRHKLAQLSQEKQLGLSLNAVALSGQEAQQKKLLVMDVDSTLIQEEVIDLLALKAGKGAEVAQITERAMRGELDFAQSLTSRVSQLAGLPLSLLEQVSQEITLSPGAQQLIQGLQAEGHVVAAVSGGFEQILTPLATRLKLAYSRANQLEVEAGLLTGRVSGAIVTAEVKEEMLRLWAEKENLTLADTVAVGDGANDLLMLKQAGLGIAFCAKPALRKAADARLDLPRLDAVGHFMNP